MIRGFAIIGMIIFHVAYNLNFFDLAVIDTSKGAWTVLAIFVQLAFILTTGMTLAISYKKNLKRRVKHALKLFFWAMLITIITWFLFEGDAVKFGVLHFFSFAILLGIPFLRSKSLTAIFGAAIIIAAPYLTQLESSSIFLMPLGLTEKNFQSLDYFPLFPWFGWFLIGVFLAQHFYPNGQRNFSFSLPKFPRALHWLGQNSLYIYLAHQPVIAGTVLLLSLA